MKDDNWKRTIKERDRYLCRRCGFDKNIHIHHIFPIKTYPCLMKITDNGITLCGNCHVLLKGKEEQTDLQGFLPNNTKIYKQLKTLLHYIEELNLLIPKGIIETSRGNRTSTATQSK